MVLIREKVSTSEIVYLSKGRSKGRSRGRSKGRSAGRSESRSKDGSKSKSGAKRYVPVVWQLGHYCFSKQARML
jgi:hypothetical protein